MNASIDELYKRFGRASHYAQQLELGLATVGLYLDYFAKGWWQKAPSPSDLSASLEIFNRRTLGQVLRKVRTLVIDWDNSEHLEDKLVEALDARNYLMHEFFKTDVVLFDSQGGLDQKLSELELRLESIVAGFAIVSSILDALVKLRSQLEDPVVRQGILDGNGLPDGAKPN